MAENRGRIRRISVSFHESDKVSPQVGHASISHLAAYPDGKVVRARERPRIALKIREEFHPKQVLMTWNKITERQHEVFCLEGACQLVPQTAASSRRHNQIISVIGVSAAPQTPLVTRFFSADHAVVDNLRTSAPATFQKKLVQFSPGINGKRLAEADGRGRASRRVDLHFPHRVRQLRRFTKKRITLQRFVA